MADVSGGPGAVSDGIISAFTHLKISEGDNFYLADAISSQILEVVDSWCPAVVALA